MRDSDRKSIFPSDDGEASARAADDTFAWLNDQPEAMLVRFKPYLVLPEIRTVPLWAERAIACAWSWNRK